MSTFEKTQCFRHSTLQDFSRIESLFSVIILNCKRSNVTYEFAQGTTRLQFNFYIQSKFVKIGLENL